MIIMKQLFIFLTLIIITTAAYAQPNVIVDTDIGSDCDDAGALAVLHKLADKGEVNILGVIFSSGKNKYGIGVCDAINTYYGRAGLTLGQYKGNDVGDATNTYSLAIATNKKRFPHQVVDSATELVSAYKTILAKQPDSSVTIVTLGHPNGLAALMKDKKGRFLVKQKVKNWVAMAYADTMTRDIVVPDEVFDKVKAHFNDREIVELTVLIASYNMNARVMQALRLDLEPVES